MAWLCGHASIVDSEFVVLFSREIASVLKFDHVVDHTHGDDGAHRYLVKGIVGLKEMLRIVGCRGIAPRSWSWNASMASC